MEFVMRDNRRRDADHDGISAAEMLRKFCDWQSSVNTVDDSSPFHHDTALLLTRYGCPSTPVCLYRSRYQHIPYCLVILQLPVSISKD
jgi:hypothetical protein